MAIERKPVIGSHNIKSIGHENGVMHIEFHDGNIYEYTGQKVTDHFEGLMKAASKGAYFQQNIRRCQYTACVKIFDAKAKKP